MGSVPRATGLLQSPIPGALVTSRISFRERQNIPERTPGIDYYDGPVIPIRVATRSMQQEKGQFAVLITIYRTRARRTRILQICSDRKIPNDILDKLRDGIWIGILQYYNGLRTSGQGCELQEGDHVKAGDFIEISGIPAPVTV